MQTNSLKDKTPTIGNTLLYAVKNGQLKRWFLLDEEATIIVATRLSDKSASWMNDEQIKELVKIRVKAMYKKKFPNAKRWSFPIFNCI